MNHEADELSKLGVKAINVQDYESSYEKQVDRAIHAQDHALEWRRLGRVRENITELQQRIDNSSSKVSIARLAKLMDRLDELKMEESQILQRIDELAEKDPLKNIFDNPDKELEITETETSSVPRVVKKRKFITTLSKDDESAGEVSSEESSVNEEISESFKDDGDEVFYRQRVKQWVSALGIEESSMVKQLDENLQEQVENFYFPDVVESGVKGFKIPKIVWERLLEYQKHGVNWILDLYKQEVGGILGDEMGLGKTIQVIAYISSLHVSQRIAKPILVVCPATVMKQWVSEIHNWWPLARTVLFHSAGTFGDQLSNVTKLIYERFHVIVTSYGYLQHRSFSKKILSEEYTAVILDEGHKIRNPLAEITIICKELKSPNRIILSGTPIQNNLIELWSLMDFVYPGRLGTLNVFKTELAIPINAGGYVNASSLQVQTSYRCACALKDLISPFLLRRVKSDVAQDLPSKQEQVLFCQLTTYQQELYKHYIQSNDVKTILSGEKNILAGIDILRKICNHPSLLKIDEEELYGLTDIRPPLDPKERSGKLNVLDNILNLWINEQRGHRVLLFCQTRQMLDIIEDFINSKSYSYYRMDGTTPISQRIPLVDRFNDDDSIFIFLLTTKVGGLGINLTGADRVIIFDPDWNPSTDMQARERAWRLGQTKPVTVYRMLTVGTIEEKIYHRQIFKQYLTNRILSDPKQTRFFKTSDLYDLFTFSPLEGSVSDTKALLNGLGDQISMESLNPMTPFEHGNNHILEGLMNITGLHSALEHDKLVEKPQREALLVEKEAQKRADEAVDALKQSHSFKSPKLTGLGMGLTSSAILSSIRKRQSLAQDASPTFNTDSTLQATVNGLLRLFQSHRDSCSSELIATAFSNINGEDAIAFRMILRTISTFQNGKWYLKPEFKNLE